MTMTMIPCNFSFFAALLWQVGECVWHEPSKYKYKLVSWWKRYFIKHFKAQNFINHEWLATSPYPVSKYIFKLNPSICSENTFYIIVTTFAEKNQILLWKKVENMQIHECHHDDNKKGKLHKKVLFWKKLLWN